MTKSAALSIRIPVELKNALEKAAQEDARSVASYVQRALEEHLKSKGEKK
ncbi:MAG: Arc family DNA-binding protein [Rhizobiaceae bacterium]|nr:Arc family DNA-binding protein [Rhizobiaceae bacterium]